MKKNSNIMEPRIGQSMNSIMIESLHQLLMSTSIVDAENVSVTDDSLKIATKDDDWPFLVITIINEKFAAYMTDGTVRSGILFRAASREKCVSFISGVFAWGRA